MAISLLPTAWFSDLSRNLRVAKIITWVAYLSLTLGLLGDGLQAGTNLVLLIIAIIPLLIFLPGLYREDHRSLILLCFVSLLYFTVVVTNLYEPDKTLFGIAALIAVVVLFISSMMYSRWLRTKARIAEGNQDQN